MFEYILLSVVPRNDKASVGYSWAVMPIQVLWISALLRFLGGGPNVAFAMIMTMAADISSDDTRFVTRNIAARL